MDASPSRSNRVAANPALEAWQAELAKGERTLGTFDALWEAACIESKAIEAAAEGLPEIAGSYRLIAARILRAAARGQLSNDSPR